MSLSVDGVWKAGVWATTVWADGVWFEGVVSQDVIRNFSLKEWRRWVKKEDEEKEELFEGLIKESEKSVEEVVQASQAISLGAPEGPMLLKAMEARQRYDEIYRKALQDTYVEEMVAEMFKADMLQMRKRMAIILLLLNQ